MEAAKERRQWIIINYCSTLQPTVRIATTASSHDMPLYIIQQDIGPNCIYCELFAIVRLSRGVNFKIYAETE